MAGKSATPFSIVTAQVYIQVLGFMDDKVFQLLLGDSIEVLAGFDDNSIDAIVTDPPYGYAFMQRSWDNFEGRDFADWTRQWAKQALRVLKPGGHLLAFGGSRTYHRLACGIEDAGFEVRDQISYYCSNDEQKEAFFNGLSPDQREQFLNAFGRPSTIDYVYGSGFPKSLNVGKAINKAAHGFPQGGPDPTSPNHGKYKGGCSEDNPAGRGFGAGPGQFMAEPGVTEEPSGLVPEALPWLGFGSALKPAHEPIVVARKPLVGTIVQNVLKYGTGAINIDGCRVETTENLNGGAYAKAGTERYDGYESWRFKREGGAGEFVQPTGRFPANVIHDGSDEVLATFPSAPGQLAPVKGTEPSSVTKNAYGARQRVPFNTREGEASANRRYTEEGGTNFAALPGPRGGDPSGRFPANVIHDGSDEVLDEFAKAGISSSPKPYFFNGSTEDDAAIYGKGIGRGFHEKEFGDSGTAARFFYCAKASKKERGPGNDWPTVKPIALMRYLVRLVTPPGGLVLDPFVGSGSTGIAALREGFRFIGIDADQHALDIAQARYDADGK